MVQARPGFSLSDYCLAPSGRSRNVASRENILPIGFAKSGNSSSSPPGTRTTASIKIKVREDFMGGLFQAPTLSYVTAITRNESCVGTLGPFFYL